MAKTPMRKCFVDGCSKQIKAWLHFCDAHYKLVPAVLKQAIHDEYRLMRRAGVRSSQEQDELVRQARDAITEKLLKKLDKRRRQGGDFFHRPSA